jgi:hypothetical protein
MGRAVVRRALKCPTDSRGQLEECSDHLSMPQVGYADLEHVDLSRLLEYTARQLPVLLLSRVSVQAFSAAG